MEALVVHEIPSGEVMMVHNAPTAATRNPEVAMPNNESLVPELPGVQETN